MEGTKVQKGAETKVLNLILGLLRDNKIRYEIIAKEEVTPKVRLNLRGNMLSVVIPFAKNQAYYLTTVDEVPEKIITELRNILNLWEAGYLFDPQEVGDGLILESLKMVSTEQFLTKVCKDILYSLPGTWICGYLLQTNFVQLVSCLRKEGGQIVYHIQGIKDRKSFPVSTILRLSPFRDYSWEEIKEITKLQLKKILNITVMEKGENLSSTKGKFLLIPLAAEEERVGFLVFGGIPKSLITATSERLKHILPLITDLLRRLSRLHAVKRESEIISAMKELIELSLQGASSTEIANKALQIGIRYSGGFKGGIFLKSGNNLYLIAHHNLSRKYLSKFNVLKVGKHVAGKVAKHNKCIVIQDSLSSPDSSPEVVKSEGYKSLIAIPLTVKNEVQGVMGILFDRSYAITREIENNMKVLGAIVGLALRHALVSEYQLRRIQLLESISDTHKALTDITSLSELSLKVKDLLSQYDQFRDVHFQQVHFQDSKEFTLEDPATGEIEGPFRLSPGTGPLSRAIKKKKTVIEPVYSGDRGTKGQKILFEYITPLLYEQKVVAILRLNILREGGPTEEDLYFLEVFKGVLDLSTRNLMVVTRVKEFAKNLEFMYNLLRTSVTLDPSKFFSSVGKTLISLFNPDAYMFAHIEDNNVVFDLLWEDGRILSYNKIPVEELSGLTAYIIKEKQPVLLKDSLKDSPVPYTVVGDMMLSYMGVPILVDSEVIGVLSVQAREPNAFTESDLNILLMIADTLAVVFQNILIHKKESTTRDFLDAVLKYVPHWIVVIDKGGRVIYSTPQVENILGVVSDRVVGSNLYKFLSPQDIEPILVAVRARGQYGPVEFTHSLTKDKSIRLSISGAINPDGMTILLVRDITQQHELEMQIQKAAYLSAVGELAAGIAHEINNPLTGVIGLLDIWLQEPQKIADERLREDLIKVRNLALRASVIARDLLSIAGPHRHRKKELFELNRAVDKVVPLFEFEFYKWKIKLERIKKDDPILLLGREGEIQQVIINLLLNAKDAMSTTRKGDLVKIVTYTQNNYGVLEISDNGPGIPKDHLRRVFDPFFTTKPPGKGTGLGLALSLRIAQDHGGTIQVESDEGKGATFKLMIPLEEVKDKEVLKFRPSILVAIANGETTSSILPYLFRNKFRIEIAETGEEFFEAVSTMDFDIVFVDDELPNLIFQEQYLWLKKRRHDIVDRLFVLIRNNPTPDYIGFLTEEDIRWFWKPIDPLALIERVRVFFEVRKRIELE